MTKPKSPHKWQRKALAADTEKGTITVTRGKVVSTGETIIRIIAKSHDGKAEWCGGVTVKGAEYLSRLLLMALDERTYAYWTKYLKCKRAIK